MTVQPFSLAVRCNRWLPVDFDSLKDAVALHEGNADRCEYYKASTLLALLGTIAGMDG